jgi:hypothetical protein
MQASNARDLSANREAVEQALVDALTAPIANTLSALGFNNIVAGVYAECLADHLSVEGIARLFDLVQLDTETQAASAA